jgi:hypothetical protein
MRTAAWRREPRGPGAAWHMFADAHGERVELLVYDCPASRSGPRMCGFEIFTRLRSGGPFHNQVAAGEAESVEGAKAAALKMVSQPRAT